MFGTWSGSRSEPFQHFSMLVQYDLSRAAKSRANANNLNDRHEDIDVESGGDVKRQFDYRCVFKVGAPLLWGDSRNSDPVLRRGYLGFSATQVSVMTARSTTEAKIERN